MFNYIDDVIKRIRVDFRKRPIETSANLIILLAFIVPVVVATVGFLLFFIIEWIISPIGIIDRIFHIWVVVVSLAILVSAITSH